MGEFASTKPVALTWQALPDKRVLDLPDRLLDLVPVGVYICDHKGLIVRYNRCAAELWGFAPKLGDAVHSFSGAIRSRQRDGTPFEPSWHPMAKVLTTGASIRNQEIVIERPNGSQILALLHIDALKDKNGAVTGAIGCFRDITEHQRLQNEAREAGQRFTAIVASSDDAIVSKDVNGIITSWNGGAERLFGYTAEEAIGKSITILIPVERHEEEPAILSRIRRGEHIDHYETVRQRKDGSLLDISLTVSPIKNADGQVIGASKIARNITERRRAEEQQRLLMHEMNHRIKNLFTVAGSIVALSARHAASPEGLARSVQERLAALARAHDLTLIKPSSEAPQNQQATTLHALIATILSPFENQEKQQARRITVRGPDVAVEGASVTAFALLLHELATNAAKYGALSSPAGRIDIAGIEEGGWFILTWTENGGPAIEVTKEHDEEGFGGVLVRATLQRLGGEIVREWKPEGLALRLTVARDRLTEGKPS